MGGGLLELVAHGVQDVFLIGNPQITFFKIVYKRHTNFSIESVRADITGNVDFGKQIVVTIPRKGDLVHTIILEVDLPNISDDGQNGTEQLSYINGLGHALIDYVELEIGGQLIDKHYGEWMEIWTQLSYDESKQTAYDTLIPRSNIDTQVKLNSSNDTSSKTVYIPLQFWFCRNIGLALPLIALQYHEVKLNIKFKPLSELVTYGSEFFTITQSGTTITKSSGPRNFDANDVGKTIYYEDGVTTTIASRTSGTVIKSSLSKGISTAQEIFLKTKATVSSASISEARVYVDFIFLDTYERTKFTQMKHRYLIEQLQFNNGNNITVNSNTQTIDLNFNLPVKSLYWVSQINQSSLNNDKFNFSSKLDRSIELSDPFTKAVILFNGIERFEERNAEYFRLIQPFQRHTRVSKLYIYMYSFALNPETHQPSGTCNFSKIDTSQLKLTYNNSNRTSTVRIYALNYNVLRIVNGMGGVAFAN